MNREQAKAYKIKHAIITNCFKNEEHLSQKEAESKAFRLINQAIGHNGIEKHWDVFCHFAEGGEVEAFNSAWSNVWKIYKDLKFLPKHRYRKVEKPFVLGGITLPEKPQTEPLNKGDIYYLPGLSAEFLFIDLTWYDDIADMAALENNQVYLTKEGAIAASKAMLAMVEQALKGEG